MNGTVSTSMALEAITTAPPTPCYARSCTRGATWIGTVRHEDGRCCTTRTACAWHKSTNDVAYRRLVRLGINDCTPHKVPMRLTWRPL